MISERGESAVRRIYTDECAGQEHKQMRQQRMKLETKKLMPRQGLKMDRKRVLRQMAETISLRVMQVLRTMQKMDRNSRTGGM